MEECMEQSLSLDIHGAAALLALKAPTIRKLCLTRSIPFYKLGRRVVFDSIELREWRNARRVPTMAEESPKHRREPAKARA
jgi:excisionase family DNA binding protein